MVSAHFKQGSVNLLAFITTIIVMVSSMVLLVPSCYFLYKTGCKKEYKFMIQLLLLIITLIFASILGAFGQTHTG